MFTEKLAITYDQHVFQKSELNIFLWCQKQIVFVELMTSSVSFVFHRIKTIPLIGPYYKSELELKSNSSEIFPVNCKLICDSTPT